MAGRVIDFAGKSIKKAARSAGLEGKGKIIGGFFDNVVKNVGEAGAAVARNYQKTPQIKLSSRQARMAGNIASNPGTTASSTQEAILDVATGGTRKEAAQSAFRKAKPVVGQPGGGRRGMGTEAGGPTTVSESVGQPGTTTFDGNTGRVVMDRPFSRKAMDESFEATVKKEGRYSQYAYENTVKHDISNIEKAYANSDYESVISAGKKYGIGTDNVHSAEKVEALLTKNVGERLSKAGVRDFAGVHKVPQRGAALVGTAFLVNNMSQRKGQQSNSELYGQSAPYR